MIVVNKEIIGYFKQKTINNIILELTKSKTTAKERKLFTAKLVEFVKILLITY